MKQGEPATLTNNVRMGVPCEKKNAPLLHFGKKLDAYPIAEFVFKYRSKRTKITVVLTYDR